MGNQTFQLGQQPYIALTQWSDVVTQPQDPVDLAIYAPGTCCYYWEDHRQHAAACHHLHQVWIEDPGTWGLVGPQCLEFYFQDTNPQAWQTGLEQRQALVGTGLGVDWRAGTRRDYWVLVQLIGLMLQVESDLGILRGYLHRATRMDRREFTPGEKRTLLKLLRERGGTERAVGPDAQAWHREREAHYRVLKRRRDLAFRLARLGALDLYGSDRATVQSLAADNIRLVGDRIGILTREQEKLVGALEAQYLEQRIAAGTDLAWTLAREFQLAIPRRPRWWTLGEGQ
ncbi:MAG: hypothetical protein KKA73_01575 [Chloroflexi bacterium]|nr:hypothetical protein [Chloroflexota bacterium]MBU1746354.1 hypothetical protein [Chloroflexota bacterium]